MTTQERWSRHVSAWTTSGLSCKDYATKAGVNPRTLTWWKSKLRSSVEAGPASATFVEVTGQLVAPTSEDGVIELDVGNTRIRVRGRVDSDALARVLDAVEGRR